MDLSLRGVDDAGATEDNAELRETAQVLASLGDIRAVEYLRKEAMVYSYNDETLATLRAAIAQSQLSGASGSTLAT